MKRLSTFLLATFATTLFLSNLLLSNAFGLDPTISLKYSGADVAMKATSNANADGSTDWQFVAPDGKLAVCVNVKKEGDYPAWRMTTRVKNLSSTEETGVVQDLSVFSPSIALPSQDASATIDAMVGSLCCPRDFEPLVYTLKPGEEQMLSTPSGRSSSEVSPFIEANVDESTGYLFGIGWTGCWRAKFANQGGKLGVEIGMLRCGFKLKPNESLLQPSVLFFERKNMTRRQFKTLVHAYTRDFNSPRDKDGNLRRPFIALTAGGGNKTPEMMRDVLNYGLKANIPFNTYWVDAGWYGAPHEDEHYSNCGPNWYRFVGDWRINTTTHPTGDLLPIANALHENGKRFLLWFEPERIHPETPTAKLAPFDKQHGMCYYGDPESFAWIENAIFSIIEKHHIDVYRQDFNMEPTGCWAAIENDEGADRVGVAEAKHIEGLYRFLDDMRAKFPWIEQENCAGGGRRIDLEMVKRACSYCRSDYYIGPKEGDTAFNLGQNMTLNLTPYILCQGGETNCVNIGDDYGFMSVISSGTVFTPTDYDGGIVRKPFTAEQTAWFQKMFGWADRLKDYYLGDFYQLTDPTYAVDDCWCAWSCDLPEQKAGFAIAFRRAQAEEATMTFELPAIDPNAKYEVEYFDGAKKVVYGKDLATLKVELLEKRSFFLIIYKQI